MNTESFSNPNDPVRHSYPLAAQKEGFAAALKLCLKTSPYIFMRLGILAAFALAAILWLAFCGGMAWLFSGRNHTGGGGIVLFLIGIGIPSGAFWWLRKYVLYILKLGHVAVLTKLITNGALPEGVNQVQYGKAIITERFGQTNILFVLDSLVTGVIAAFNRTLDWLSKLLPIPGMEGAMAVIHRVVNAAATYIDETIFSYNLARNDENVWRSSLDGLVYYAQNVKPVLKTAAWCVVLEYTLTFGCFLVLLVPCWLLAYPLPDAVASFSWALAILLAAGIRDALLQPVFLTMVALTFHKNIQNQSINLNYSGLLNSASSKFQELTTKAAEWKKEQLPGEGNPGEENPKSIINTIEESQEPEPNKESVQE